MAREETEHLRSALGLTDAPLVRANLEAISSFFKSLEVAPGAWLDYLRGIDFHRLVKVVFIPPQTRLSRHRSLGNARPKPFVYLTQPGTSPFSTGTSFEASKFELFETTSWAMALESYASAISFSPSDRVSRVGGGIQYIVSEEAFRRFRQLN
jgi:hypothetical protein